MSWFRRAAPVEEGLDAETRRWLVEAVDDGDGGTEPRYEGLRCPHCQGVHFRACPRVRQISFHESGRVASVRFWREGEYDDSDVIWPELIFAEDPPEAAGEA